MALLNGFSIQLYSVREETARNFPEVLKRLGDIGYTGVEFAGYGGIPAKNMRGQLDANGLVSIGSHIGLDRLHDGLDEELTYNQELGSKYIIVSYAPIKTRDDALALAELLNKSAERSAAAGFSFAYHNHSHEFVNDRGEYLLDILFANVDSAVKMELDIYWAAYAGVNPLAYMEKNGSRLRLLHVKQMLDYESRKCVDLDEGVIDYLEIITRAKALGVEHFILEQEEYAVSAFVSAEKGYKHIMSL